MRLLLILPAISLLLLSESKCGKKQKSGEIYKARLEIKALCMNYTIGVLEGAVDSSMVVEKWVDDATKKGYRNAFRLGNPCDFPDSIKQGDEFYFVIDTARGRQCAVCMAYYPTPPKALRIKVVNK